MAKRTKKVGIVGKYGTRYGASLRKTVKKMEITQHSTYTCPFCGKYLFNSCFKMRFLSSNDVLAITLDQSVKNKWRWQWLETDNGTGTLFKEWCKKIDAPGVCYCIVCNQTLSYGSSGKKCLMDHSNNASHLIAFSSARNSYQIPGAISTSDISRKKSPISDRVLDNRIIVGSFLAEHCLPYSLSQPIIDLCKKLAQDTEALNITSMGRTAATYTMTYGIAEAMKKELSQSLQGNFFSLNIDEATNNAGNKCLNVLVQYYSDTKQQVCVELLGSRQVNISTAENIFNALESILNERNLLWSQVISVTMDNCNVMRGAKNGVEAIIKKANPCLLDVSGDTVHMINNAAKAFFVPVEDLSNFQTFASNIYYDIEDSPKARDIFREVQEMLYGKPRTIFRPIANRFLQMKEVCDRLDELWDSLFIYYYGFLSTLERAKYKTDLDSVFVKYGITTESQSKLEGLALKIKKNITKAGKERKEVILLHLFHKKNLTYCTLQLYRGILQEFSRYVKTFQSVKPQCHRLHADMYEQFRTFLSGYIIPDKICDPKEGMKGLCNLNLADKSIQVRDRQLGLGVYCLPHLKEFLRNKSENIWINDFFNAVRVGYQNAADKMKKMPLLNSTIIQLSALDPGLQRSTETATALTKLAEKLPNVICSDKCGMLDREIRLYTIDQALTQLDADETSPDFRLDTDWWSKAINMKEPSTDQVKYPLLGLLVKSLLSIFSGPLVESTFNIMDDIIECDQSRMLHRNYEGIAIIKSHLKAKGETSLTMSISQQMRNFVNSAKHLQQVFIKSKTYPIEKPQASSNLSTPVSSSSHTTSSLSNIPVIKTSTVITNEVSSICTTAQASSTISTTQVSPVISTTLVSTISTAEAHKSTIGPLVTSMTKVTTAGPGSRKRKHPDAPNTESMKRKAVGIWKCGRCSKTVAGGAWVYSTTAAAQVRSAIRRLRELKEI
ncbi:hypothetical protein BgiBS90_021653 [Biomphalaria glabrata]|nr:hypothetical protein BgiBS90_021653 [Biomphalaria glabrata]